MFRTILATSSIAAICLLPGCAPGDPNSHDDPDTVALTLPSGSVAAGKQAFEDLRCTACHAISGVDGLSEPLAQVPVPDLGVALAGRSRDSIATAIVLPSHIASSDTQLWSDWSQSQRVWVGPGKQIPDEEVAEDSPQAMSIMTDYSDVITVQELSDLVTFLEDSAQTE
jgi:hypothetical protein